MTFRHPRRWTDLDIAVLAVATALGVWSGRSGTQRALPAAVLVMAAISTVSTVARRRRVLLAVASGVLFIGAAWRSDVAWISLQPDRLGAYTGWAELVEDPRPMGRGTRITIEISGERFDAWLYGVPQRRVQNRQSGEWLWIEGTRRRIVTGRDRAGLRHVVGRFSVVYAGDWRTGSALTRSAARVRRGVRQAAEATMDPGDAALFAGLVLGDVSRQTPAMVNDFQVSGLSHLTAVSGQNVTLVLVAIAPLLRRMRRRWVVQLGVVGWLALATRFEPSVLRAAAMAALGLVAMARGQPSSAPRLLALACAALLFVDPMLLWRVGFWLSVTATIGVCVLSPPIERRLRGPRWLALPMSVTLGAQLAVAVPSLLVFGRLPVWSLVANLLAVPVAGAVMTIGLPLALLANAVPAIDRWAMFLPRIGTRWVRLIAALAARLEPRGWAAVVSWVVVLVGLACWIGPPRRADRCANLSRWPPT